VTELLIRHARSVVNAGVYTPSHWYSVLCETDCSYSIDNASASYMTAIKWLILRRSASPCIFTIRRLMTIDVRYPHRPAVIQLHPSIQKRTALKSSVYVH